MSDLVAYYFDADAGDDVDKVVELFTDDAIVVDESQTWRGSAEIRAWREGPAAKFQYTTDITSVERVAENRYRASGRIDGNFPGSTANLHWDFTVAGERISRLEIAP
jgi:ketosteroid isomerase-like protein